MGSVGHSICLTPNHADSRWSRPRRARNAQTKTRDLDVAIVGDITSIKLPMESFDVVYSSFVLELVPRADAALKNFVRWLKPGGPVDPASA